MATITITTPANQDTRIAAAIGQRLNLRDASNAPRSATGAEVKQWLVDQMKLCVREVEAYNARVAADASVTDVTPT